jgi:hypothetical protein
MYGGKAPKPAPAQSSASPSDTVDAVAPGDSHDPSHLRLVPSPAPNDASRSAPDPIQDTSDPRWILAQRTSTALQGHVLSPTSQAQLLALAQRLGMSSFAARLVMTIVQEQTRRGFPLEAYPHNALAHLALVPRARACSAAPATTPVAVLTPRAVSRSHIWPTIATVVFLLGFELLLVWRIIA